MEHKLWTLGSKKAVAKHLSIVNSENAYSLTLTLNPFYNSLSIIDQYNKCQSEVIKLVKELGPYFTEFMITGEFTKEFNVHWHCYFVMKCEYMVFEQNMKHLKYKYKLIGNNYKLKLIDNVTDNLKGYPFKDIERTNSYAEAMMQRFNPRHIYIYPTGNIIIEKTVVNHLNQVSINAYYDKILNIQR